VPREVTSAPRLVRQRELWFDWSMDDGWTRRAVAGGLVRVWLPPDETLQEIDDVAIWSPDSELGRFTVASSEGSGDGDALLEAERSYGDVEVEDDERVERGGLQVRRLRYRSRRQTPREVVRRPEEGRTDVGGEDVETLADFLLLQAGSRLIRAGYAVRTDAPEPVRASLAEVYDRLEIGDEGQ
jgi:hypothetical protein